MAGPLPGRLDVATGIDRTQPFSGSRRLGTLLFGVSPKDAATIAVTASLLLGVALVACWLPGHRAARIRPLEAISME